MNEIKKFTESLFSTSKYTDRKSNESLYAIQINSISNQNIDFNDFKGKTIVFVNVASNCGFTPQYKELQQLHETYKNNLVVIAVPCNQFGNQEPGSAKEIELFCESNYGVSFLITEKIDVKGEHQHPLYAWLTQKKKNGVKTSSVKWNFQKYLIDDKGHLIDHFFSNTNPMSRKITKHIKQ